MSARLRAEGGFTLVELMLASTLMVLILGATLITFSGFEKTTRSNGLQNDAAERARGAIDQLARDLRNGTTPSPEQPAALEKATDYDLVTQTADDSAVAGSANTRNVRRVRYCLDASDPENGKLWYQAQTWTTATPPALPSTASCPDDAWGNKRILADRLVNQRGGTPVKVWRFNSDVLAQVSRIRMELVVDVNSASDRPVETKVQSAVFMRNQNQAPVPSFTATVNGIGHVLLNATASTDPEGARLVYRWYDGATLISQSGIAVDYAPPSSGNHTITLKVYDPSGLYGTTQQVVNVP